MISTLNISRGYRHANNLEYQGSLSKYQTQGTVEYQKANNNTKYQNLLYERAMFGLGVYSKEEIQAMPPEKRKRILKVHKRTKRIINTWKQEMITTLSNHVFATLFPNMALAKSFLKDPGVDPDIHCDMDLADLGITKKDIILKLLEEKILPRDVFNPKLT